MIAIWFMTKIYHDKLPSDWSNNLLANFSASQGTPASSAWLEHLQHEHYISARYMSLRPRCKRLPRAAPNFPPPEALN
jgi:hypothetical protein